PNGNIEFLGRGDYQVKIRGFRIELGEIEAVLSQHPSIVQTVVIAYEHIPGDKRLVAYVVPNQHTTATISELRRFLKEKLPEYMVPSVFVLLEALPLTPSGKVNRSALPAPEQALQELEATFVAPRDDLEEKLSQIWEEVLGIQPIGIMDNFFDLGGHSLLAVRLFAQIEHKFAKKLPLATLFRSGTVEAIAKILRQGEEKALGNQVLSTLAEKKLKTSWSSLVEIQPKGSKPPLFCIHPLGGETLCYRDLARHLGSEQPVYGLQPIGLDGKELPHTRIADMASCYIQEIKSIQPNGPYFLLGWSFGGFVVYEMAQQLHSQGEKVSLLGMIDSVRPGYFQRAPLLMRVFLHLNNIFQRGPAYLWQKARGWTYQGKYEIQQRYKRYLNAAQHVLDITPHLAENDEHLKVIDANMQALDEYIFQVYPGRMTLFRTSDENRCEAIGEQYDPQFGWGDITTGGIDINYIPGSHLSVMEEPYVQVIAEQLKVYLEKAALQST
ncbi:MAG: non-ribosomal peptide synthetase, partial [Nostocaceae cyanobacterium]|nr:non-ribosomal peptide synthetase [Nostocaceae cyanobacterium]